MISDQFEEELVKTYFKTTFDILQGKAYANAKAKGFWDSEILEPMERVAVKIALMHEELSEALTAARHGNPPDDKIPEFSGLEAEFADVIIRIMDLSGRLNLNVSGAIQAKMAMNTTRSHKHGKLF